MQPKYCLNKRGARLPKSCGGVNALTRTTRNGVNLIIDIGNTCAKLVCFDGEDIVGEQRIDRGEAYLIDEFCGKYNFTKGIYSTVADITPLMREKIQELPFNMLELVSGKTPVPIKVKYATPLTLGTDRLAAAVAAARLKPGRDVMVVDIGTCVTFDFVNAAGEFIGGNISPGPQMRFKALHQFTARLPKVERRGVAPEIGTTTMTAIRSGVLYGIKYEIEGYINNFAKKYPGLFIYITGGVHLDLNFADGCETTTDDYIVPRGLNSILLYNTPDKTN